MADAAKTTSEADEIREAKAAKSKPVAKLGVVVEESRSHPRGWASTRESWAAAAAEHLDTSPEIAYHALEPDTYYTLDEAKTMVEQFLARPVNPPNAA